MMLGENKEATKGIFRWQIGIALILLLAVATYLISAQSEEKDYKKSGKFTDSDITVTATAATQGDFLFVLSISSYTFLLKGG